jgi:hypothetical protein
VPDDENAMSLPETIQHIYEDLSRRYEKRNDLPLRDAFLMLAADVAYLSGRAADAERLRALLLAHNPNCLLRPFPSFAAAMQSLDIQDYLADLRKQYPPAEAESLLTRIRANPLGMPLDPKKEHDTQEVNPPTSRTIDMPTPNLQPRKSPYENYHVPLPDADEGSGWSASASMLWFFVLCIAGVGTVLWTFVRPLWDPA